MLCLGFVSCFLCSSSKAISVALHIARGKQGVSSAYLRSVPGWPHSCCSACSASSRITASRAGLESIHGCGRRGPLLCRAGWRAPRRLALPLRWGAHSGWRRGRAGCRPCTCVLRARHRGPAAFGGACSPRVRAGGRGCWRGADQRLCCPPSWPPHPAAGLQCCRSSSRADMLCSSSSETPSPETRGLLRQHPARPCTPAWDLCPTTGAHPHAHPAVLGREASRRREQGAAHGQVMLVRAG